MYEYSIEILKEEIEKNYEVKRGCPTPSEKELIKIDWADEELQQVISILEENQTFFGMKIVLKEDIPKMKYGLAKIIKQ